MSVKRKNCLNRLETGSYKKLPHHVVVGAPTSFYVYIQQHDQPGNGVYKAGVQGACAWITGQHAFEMWNRWSSLIKSNQQQFIKEVTDVHRDAGPNKGKS